MKLLFLFLIALNLFGSNVIKISDGEVNFKNFPINYYDDKNTEETIKTISDVNFTIKPSRYTAGIKKNIWIQLPLKNMSNEEKYLYITYNNIHILKNITFYTLQDSNILKTIYYDNYKNIDIKNRVGNLLYYEVTLAPQEQKNVYINIQVNSQLFFEISISDLKNYSKNIIHTKWLFVFISGLLIAQAIYYFFLFFLTPYKEYFYFSMFIFSVVLWSSYIYGGLAHYAGIYGKDGFIFNSIVFVAPIFTILLYKSIFVTENKFKKIKLILNFIISGLLFLTLLQFITSLNLIESISVTRYGSYVYLTEMFIFLGIVFYMYSKKVPLMGYFVLGYSVSVVGALVASAFFLGLVPYNNMTFYAHSISTFIESILFSILLAYRVKTLNLLTQEKDHALELQDSKIDIMSEVIDNVAHQWRQPLSAINSSILLIEDELIQPRVKKQNIIQELDAIEMRTEYMSRTISDFQESYSGTKEKKVFNVEKLIEHSVLLMKNNLKENNINIQLHLDKTINIENYPNEFQQALVVFLNNAKDAIIENSIQNPKIKIVLKQHLNEVFFKICDNGGGVDEDKIQDIFNPYFTTKHKSKGKGLGLYMAKMIIEKNMEGKVSAKNVKDGLCVQVVLFSEVTH